jgi:iron(III) transport system substrate-binding protein
MSALQNNRSSISLVGLLAILFCFATVNAHADWKADWEKIVQAAEKEGQVTVYIGGYGAVIDTGVFQKAYPKIKVVSVTGSGTELTGRIATERRAGKYLPDVYSSGGNSLYQILYLGKMLDPIKPASYFRHCRGSGNPGCVNYWIPARASCRQLGRNDAGI